MPSRTGGPRPAWVGGRLFTNPERATPRGTGARRPASCPCRARDRSTSRPAGRQLQRLRTELDRGPAEHGWTDQRWTLARIATVIARLFHIRYTLRGTAYLLHRMGWSWKVPRHRAAERNEDAVAEWRTLTWAKVRG